MKRIFIILGILLLSSEMSVRLLAHSNDAPERVVISSIGRAECEIIPDIITLKFMFSKEHLISKLSVGEAQDRIIAFMDKEGIDSDKLLIYTGMLTEAKANGFRCDDLEKAMYTIELNTAKQLQILSEELGDMQASYVEIEKTEVSNMDSIKDVLIERAILNAKKKVEQYALPMGQKVGKAIFVKDGQLSAYEYRTPLNSHSLLDDYYNNNNNNVHVVAYNSSTKKSFTGSASVVRGETLYQASNLDYKTTKIWLEVYVEFVIE